MPYRSSLAPRLVRRGALVAAAAAAVAPVAPAVALALFLLMPGALAAQAIAGTAAGTTARIAADAWRPDLSVPLSVLVKIGTSGRTSVGTILGSVLRVPRGSEPKSKPRTTATKKTPSAGAPAAASGAAVAARVLNTADRYLGTPYVFGGTTPGGFDCSGFVQYVFRRHGVELPRTAAQQGGAGRRVRAAVGELRAGDLMLFDASSKRPGIDHVAIYAGRGRMIHSSSSGGGVGYDDLSTKRGRWFVDHMVAARRVVANGQSLVDALQAWAPAPLDPPDDAPPVARRH